VRRPNLSSCWARILNWFESVPRSCITQPFALCGSQWRGDYRQKTPKNAVRIAEVLLRAGADINAVADIYGGSDTLGLASTSVWPFLVGVQEALIDILLEYGANLHNERLVNRPASSGTVRARPADTGREGFPGSRAELTSLSCAD